MLKSVVKQNDVGKVRGEFFHQKLDAINALFGNDNNRGRVSPCKHERLIARFFGTDAHECPIANENHAFGLTPIATRDNGNALASR